jgi:hypothetical protein
MTDTTIELGRLYRDTVSGWEGTATARYEYMNGCVRVEISSHDKDGKPEAFVFDIQQVEPVPAPVPIASEAALVGGPRDNRPVQR